MTSFVNASAEWSPARAADALLDLDEKLADLNRRALLRKLDTLARRWQVPLDGISTKACVPQCKHVIELFIGASTTKT